MKTTSLFTITGIVAFALLGVSRFNAQTHQSSEGNGSAIMDLARDAKDNAFLEFPGEVKSSENAVEDNVQHNSVELITFCEPGDASGLCLENIIYIEPEDSLDLGFDVNEYLPAGFDPYADANSELDLNTVQFIEEDDFEGLGFDTAAYLPDDFNPYAGMGPDLDAIEFIEAEEPIELGFDTSAYLPEGFNPYALPELNLDEVIFITAEEPIDLGFDVNAYLPADFDPYAPAEFDLDQVSR